MTAISQIFFGPMGAGKSLALLKIAEANRMKNILAFKPRRDCRDGAWIKSRGFVSEFPAHLVDSGHELISYTMRRADENWVDLVLVDELHLFQEPTAMHIGYYLAGKNIPVYAAGLDLDFRGQPFPVSPDLDMVKIIASYQVQTPVWAQCHECQGPATHTQRLIAGEPAPSTAPLILVGGDDVYQARCQNCHEVKEAICV